MTEQCVMSSDEVVMMLRLLDERDEQILKSYELSAESLQFTKHPLLRARESFGRDDVYCVSYFLAGQLVGFLALDQTDSLAHYTDMPQAILLRSLSLDERYRGKGYASTMLSEIDAYIRVAIRDQIKCIVLSVGEINTAARKLYERADYTYTGNSAMGRTCRDLIMLKEI